MLFFLLLSSCSEKQTENTATENIAETDETTSNTQTTDVPKRDLKCRMMEMYMESVMNGGTNIYTTAYTWDGNVQSFNGGTYTYNDYGYIVEAQQVQENWQQTTTYTYDCDKWCKLLRMTTGDISTDLVYTWEGNIQKQGDSRYWEYNDYGYVLESYDAGVGYENISSSTYECDEWCRQLTQTWTSIVNGVEDTHTIVYEWTGNRQTWDDGYNEFNVYGYLTETYSEIANGSTLLRISYECD